MSCGYRGDTGASRFDKKQTCTQQLTGSKAAKRGTLHNAVAQAAMKLRMLVNSLDSVKRALSSTSWVALYTTLYKTLIVQLDQVLASDTAPANNDFDDEALTGWWDPVGGGLLDLSNWLDSEAPGLDALG